ncbi:MAG TPA: ABC transporter permease [Chloroflexota bacterium]|nr:ABC transporter permease [Chloroflexota bacterium]
MTVFGKVLVASLKEFARDRTSLSFTIVLPLLLVVFFGFAYGGSGSTFSVGIVHGVGRDTAPLLSQLRSDHNLRLVRGGLASEMANLRSGSVDAVLVFTGAGRAPQLYYDARSGGSALAAQGLRSITTRNGSTTVRSILLRPVQAVSHSRLNFVVAGILATAIMWLGIFAAIPLVQQREEQVLRRFAATPLSRGTLVGGQVASRLLIGLGQAVFILLAARLFFGVPLGTRAGSSLVGGLVVVAALVLLGSLAFVAIGYAIAALSSNQHGAHAWAQLLSMPMLLLAGVFFPLGVMPGFLRPLIALLPLTYLADAFRQTAVQGQIYAPLSVDLAVLAAWVVVPLAIAVRYFKWR